MKKLLLLIAAFLLLVPLVFADMNSDLYDELIVYYKPNTTISSDSSPQNNIPTVGVGSPVYDSSTKLLGEASTIFTSDRMEYAMGGDFDTAINQTIVWWWAGDVSANMRFYSNRLSTSGGAAGELYIYYYNNNFYCRIYDKGGVAATSVLSDSSTDDSTHWNMGTCRINVTGNTVCATGYINLTEGSTACTTGGYDTPAQVYSICGTSDDARMCVNNRIDNLLHINKSIDDIELVYLFNGGIGIELEAFVPVDTTPPEFIDAGCKSCSPYQNYLTVPWITDDFTPTFNLTTNEVSTCAVMGNETGMADYNYTDMIANGGVECTTTGATQHICTVQESNVFTLGQHKSVYMGCKDEEGNEELDSIYSTNMSIYTFGATCVSDCIKATSGCGLYLESGCTISS